MTTQDLDQGRAIRRARFDPLWVKAPVVLLRFPALLASLATGALLLALAASAYPMFISATSSAALEKQIRYTTRFGAGVGVTSQSAVLDIPGQPNLVETFRRRDELVRKTLHAPRLAPIVTTIEGPTLTARSVENPKREIQVRLLYRTGSSEHVTMAAGGEGSGGLMADLTAGHLRLEPGDEIELYNAGPELSRRLRIDGFYEALFNKPQTPYWIPQNENIYPRGDSGPPPTFLFVDAEQLLRIARAVAPEEIQPGGFPTDRLTETWEAPLRLREPITLEDARNLRAFANRFEREFRTSNRFSDVFCFLCFRGIPIVFSNITQVVTQTEQRIAPVEGPVRLVLVAGLLVSLAVVAGAGAFAVATRRTETGLLFARGMNPLSVAVKTCLESLIPAAAGAAGGFGLAALLVKMGGPDGPVSGDAVRAALIYAAIAIPVSVLLLGMVAGVSFARYSESTSERLAAIAKIPWEVAFLVAGGYFYNLLQSGGALVKDDATGVTRPSVALLLFPIMMIGGLGMLAARGYQALVGRLRNSFDRASSALYLAIHRLAGARRLAMLLFAGAALALGIFVHGQTIVRSLEKTVDAKAYLFVGSDVQGTISADIDVPSVPFPITKATRLLDAGTVAPGEIPVDLLAVDPDTVSRVTYWDSGFGAPSIEDVTDAIRDPGDGPLRVAVANADLGTVDSFTFDVDKTVPVEVVDEVRTFPGTSSQAPLLIADAAALERLFPVLGPLEDARASVELWAKGDPQRIVSTLNSVEDPPYTIITAEQVKDIPSISAVIDTFGVLNVLGLGAGLLVIVVLLMYLQARQRARIVSSALSRRMGLSTKSHRRALTWELAVLLLGSFLLGTILAIATALIIVGMIDPLESIPPDPLFTPPILRFVVTAGVLLLIAVVGGAITNRRAARANIAEVMRVAE